MPERVEGSAINGIGTYHVPWQWLVPLSLRGTSSPVRLQKESRNVMGAPLVGRMRVTLSLLLALLFTVIGSVAGLSQERPWSQHEAIQAEEAVQGLRSWKDVYRAFKQFGHCDDGAIWEGYSDSVVRLLSVHWEQLHDLNTLSKSDKKFLAFVIRHIDATTDESELKSV